MNTSFRSLNQKNLVIILAYAPTGLGHLRVTEALYRGLPPEVNTTLLRAQDQSSAFWHYLTSIMPGGTKILEFSQQGLSELIFTKVYRSILRSQTKTLYQQMSTILDERVDLPKTVLVVATHFGLAHQLAQIKDQLELDKWVKIILVVQVTDDTIQHIWYIPGADITFVPSQKTKQGLEQYGKKNHLPPVRFEVLPYPVSPSLAEKLIPSKYQDKIDQLDPEGKSLVEVAIPISGAAVGLKYTLSLIDDLHKRSDRFKFNVICRFATYTQTFLAQLTERQFINIEVSPSTREIVDKYENIYHHKVIALEVTKPSEQAFKSLLNPQQQGGSILLFSKPIGRQEFDNLNFLRRHQLIPTVAQQQVLWDEAQRDIPFTNISMLILQKIPHWRGIIIPQDPQQAGQVINWCLKEGIFKIMTESFIAAREHNHFDELGSDGVRKFWSRVAKITKEIS